MSENKHIFKNCLLTFHFQYDIIYLMIDEKVTKIDIK